MTQARSVTANFTQIRHRLTVGKIGSGTVTSSPGGVSCGSDCSEDYNQGTTVTLNASAASSSWVFTGWSGACSGSGACTVTMNAAKSVTATFTRLRTLTVTPDSHGTVTGSQIACGSDCSGTYLQGTSVTLTATPNAHYLVAGWAGCDAPSGNRCTMTMGSDKTVRAIYMLESHTLTTATDGDGSCTIDPAGGTYTHGTTVELTVTPDVGSQFDGWGGDCSGSEVCSLTLDGDRSATATCSLKTYTLSVTKDGKATGSVSSSPAGVECGATCEGTYKHGTEVTLDAEPGLIAAFIEWGGACTGTTCTFTMTGDTTVNATFDLEPTLVGWWPLDDGVGSVAHDVSCNDLHGALHHAPQWVMGQARGALAYDGIGDYVQVSEVPLLDIRDALTITAWVKPIPAEGTIQQVLSKDNAYELEFGKFQNQTTYSARLNNVIRGAGRTPLEDDVWQHLAITWDGTTVRYYYNGLADGTAPFAGLLDVTPSHLGLGGRPAAAIEGGPTFFLNGRLDDVRLFGRALGADEIAAIVDTTLGDVFPPRLLSVGPNGLLPPGTTSFDLVATTDTAASCAYATESGLGFGDMTPFMLSGGHDHGTSIEGLSDGNSYTYHVRCQDPSGNTSAEVTLTVVVDTSSGDLESGLVSHWTFDEGAGCTISDAEGNNDLVLGPDCPNDAPGFVEGVSGTALSFAEGNHEASAANPTITSQMSAVSVAAWMRHQPTFDFRALVDQRDAGADGYNLYLAPDSKAFLRVNDQTLVSATAVADGAWHHVVAVYDGLELRIYVDGVLDAQTAATSGGGVDTQSALKLGHHFGEYPATANGQLDNVRIYDRALTDAEVGALFVVDQ